MGAELTRSSQDRCTVTTVASVSDVREAVRASIVESARCDAAYLTMNVLATIIACYGLLEDSPSVVIGAMLIAMLLGPISAVALGLVDGNDALTREAMLSLLAGAGAVYGTALVFGFSHSVFPLTAEIYARTSPNLMDLMVALAGGAAGAYAMTSPRLNVAFVGVAIATALVPPLASSAICLTRGEYWLSAGALLLALANMVGIQVASSIVMWFKGYRGPADARGAIGRLFRHSVVNLLILAGLMALLTVNLQRLIVKEGYEASVRHALQTRTSTHQGAYLVDVRFRRDPAHLVVAAVYRTPVAFVPDEVAAIERGLPVPPGGVVLELQIRSIPITVASKDGYLYANDDAAYAWIR
jgi:uncharacterized hydrophobic protein (TIGR00271 family)